MRRTLVAALAACAALGAAGCGGADTEEEPAGGGGGSGEAAEGGGAPAKTAGFDGTTIKLGVLTPLSGPVAVIGEPLTAGNEVKFEAVNAAGGIAGKYKVELVQEDTQYKPDLAVQKYNKIKGEVVAFAQSLGTPPTLALVPQLKRDNLVAQPASLDAFWVKEPNLLPVGAPYQIQAINALEYYVKQEGEDKKICSMYQDDAYGEAGKQGVDFAAENLGFSLASTQKYKAGDKDVTGQIQQLRRAQCDAVFLTGVPSDAGTIYGTAAKLGFTPRWIGQSASWIDELGDSPLADYLKQNVWIVAEGTEWGDEKVPGMKQMVADVEKYAPEQEPDYYFGFGYNAATAMTALLEKAVELGDLSKDGIKAALDQLGTVSFNGLAGDYQYGANGDRNPPRQTTIFEVDPDKPFSLGTLEYNYEAPFAKDFEFKLQGS